ncbi:MAG: hypothetical protein GXO25_00945 [Euryarchaeota archaeon]|nr:hypothetical protein [Euryarchaeota archaeon]
MVEKKENDAKEVREILEALNETVPALIKGIVDALYSAQSAEDFGKQVAGFYKSMVDAGMTNEQAFALTKQFMESRDIVGVLKKILEEGNWSKMAKASGNKEDIDKMVDEAVREATDEIEKEKN